MLELAARLRELPRDDLAAALHSRQFEPNGVHDLFDLAELLLSPDSLDHAISRLDRRRLAVLAAAAELAAGNAGGTTVDAVHGELGSARGIRRSDRGVERTARPPRFGVARRRGRRARPRARRAHLAPRSAPRRRPPVDGRARRTRTSRARHRRRGRPQHPRAALVRVRLRHRRGHRRAALRTRHAAGARTRQGRTRTARLEATRRGERHGPRRTAPPVPPRRRGRAGRARGRVLARVRSGRHLGARVGEGALAAPGRVLARPHSRAAARARGAPHRHPHCCGPARRRALVLPGGRALARRRPRPAAGRSRGARPRRRR